MTRQAVSGPCRDVRSCEHFRSAVPVCMTQDFPIPGRGHCRNFLFICVRLSCLLGHSWPRPPRSGSVAFMSSTASQKECSRQPHLQCTHGAGRQMFAAANIPGCHSWARLTFGPSSVFTGEGPTCFACMAMFEASPRYACCGSAILSSSQLRTKLIFPRPRWTPRRLVCRPAKTGSCLLSKFRGKIRTRHRGTIRRSSHLRTLPTAAS